MRPSSSRSAHRVEAFTAHYDGSRWTEQVAPSPAHDNRLVSISGVASDDVWAVGFSNDASGLREPLAEHWDGSTWTQVSLATSAADDVWDPPRADHSSFTSISAVSTAHVWAAGDSGFVKGDGSQGKVRTLIEHWDGTRWSIVQSPTPRRQNYVYGISADSRKDAWLVGAKTTKGAMFVEHWNGTAWEASTPF